MARKTTLRHPPNGRGAPPRHTAGLPPAGSALAALSLAVLALAGDPAGAAAQVRISEALVNPLGADAGNQVVEITNVGLSTVSVGGWRLVSPNDLAVLPAGHTLAPGARYLLHLAASGTNDALHFYTGSAFAPVSSSAHSLALYASAGSVGDPSALRDFVQWGTGGQSGETTAVSAGLWSAGEFVPITSEGNSMQLCSSTFTGATAWIEASPTLGDENNCSSQSEDSTWGRLKGLYR